MKRISRTVSPETRAKLSAANKGKTLSLEHRARISAGHKRRTRSSGHLMATGDHPAPDPPPRGPGA